MWGLYRWLWHSLNQYYFEIPEAPWEKRVISCSRVMSHVMDIVPGIGHQCLELLGHQCGDGGRQAMGHQAWREHGLRLSTGLQCLQCLQCYIGPIHRTVTREWQVHPLLGHLSGSTLEAGEPASSGMVWDLCLDLWPMASHVIPWHPMAWNCDSI